MFDAAAAWTELGAWIAEEPNRGRDATLRKMAELAHKHSMPDDELERALRLVGPRAVDLLFNRVGQLAEELVPRHEETETKPAVPEGSAERRPEGVGRSMAVA